MKNPISPVSLAVAIAVGIAAVRCWSPSSAHAVEPAAGPAAIADWGTPEDPDGDCEISVRDGQLEIKVPGGPNSHDLSAELAKMNSPRVMREITGDFAIQLRVDGKFDPGGDSSQQGRSGYAGAGILVMADDQNYVRLERATLQWGSGQAHPYANFELRVDGQNTRFGTTGDAQIEGDKPTFLRVERSGDVIRGAVSHDGQSWTELNAKELPVNWPEKVKVGVAAVSTSMADFRPVFSDLKLEAAGTGSKSPPEVE